MLALLTYDARGATQAHPLPQSPIVVGRRPQCDLVLLDATVSGRHARLYSTGDHILVTDLGSTNGTWVNGEKVQFASVRSGDELRFGTQIARVLLADDASAQSGQGASESSLQTGARLVALQGMRPGTAFELNRAVWTLGKQGASRLVFVLGVSGWTVTLLDGSAPLKINGQDVHSMPAHLHDKDHIVYQALALQFECHS